jgi:hypothetical protein
VGDECISELGQIYQLMLWLMTSLLPQPVAQDFIDFALSDVGQAVVVEI